MIEVEYYPSGLSPFPDPKTSKCQFANAQALYDWVQEYVCHACLVDFYEFHGKYPETLKDWLDMGCGCEIGITDNHNMIDWNYTMKLPDNFDQIVAKYTDGNQYCIEDFDFSKNAIQTTEPTGEHTWKYCDLCERKVVICGKCGNNTCNGGHGTVDGKDCDKCDSAYDLDMKGFK